MSHLAAWIAFDSIATRSFLKSSITINWTIKHLNIQSQWILCHFNYSFCGFKAWRRRFTSSFEIVSRNFVNRKLLYHLETLRSWPRLENVFLFCFSKRSPPIAFLGPKKIFFEEIWVKFKKTPYKFDKNCSNCISFIHIWLLQQNSTFIPLNSIKKKMHWIQIKAKNK